MSQHYLYHWVPKNMKGTILYPLNQLKDTEPEIYDEHVQKYVGRERLLTRTIPYLNCLWNDVLHLTAVHPVKVKDAMIKAGKKVGPLQFYSYEIPINMITGSNSIVYLYKNEKSVLDETMYELFNIDHMDQYNKISDATIDYYRKCFQESRKPLVYHLVPHILYMGSIDTAGLNIVSNY